jgi:hypothetical protein
MDADAECLLRCREPNCQKALPIKWGTAVGFRAYTGQIYCDEFCHDADEKASLARTPGLPPTG